MRRFWLLLLVLLAACSQVNLPNDQGGTGDDDSNTIQPLDALNPTSGTYGGSTYPGELYNALAKEDAGRWSEQGFKNLVSTIANANACLGATVASLTMTPTACVAYNAGYRSTETGSITFPNASTCWVAMDENTSGSNPGLSNFTRVGTTHYLIDCIDVTQPAMAADSQLLMEVVTSGGSITTVTDLRNPSIITGTTNPVASGGTGQTSLTAHSILVGEGTSPVGLVACAANNFLAGVSSADPACRALLSSDVPGFDSVTVTGTPTSGQIPVATAGTTATWQTVTGTNTIQLYTTGSGNFTIPAGITMVCADIYGAGGGGAGGTGNNVGGNGGGGGGGAHTKGCWTGLTPGGTLAYVVGAAGTAGTGGAAGGGDGTSGGAGGGTTFNTLVANGGAAGTHGTGAASGTGGAGGAIQTVATNMIENEAGTAGSGWGGGTLNGLGGSNFASGGQGGAAGGPGIAGASGAVGFAGRVEVRW